jgi:hypothetical protein
MSFCRALVGLGLLAACQGVSAPEGLTIHHGEDSVEGTFAAPTAIITFRATSGDDVAGTVELGIDGVQIRAAIDLVDTTFTEDGGFGVLDANQLAGLLALRDALVDEQTALVTEHFEGRLLMRYADHLAEAPVGYELSARAITFSAAAIEAERPSAADADGCGGDGVTCLSGTKGTSWAIYDQGQGSDGTCTSLSTKYGDGGSCPGRCGAGCNFLDHDYTWDCLDHDRCLDQYGGSSASPNNPNCGDEFTEAVDDWAATMGPLC